MALIETATAILQCVLFNVSNEKYVLANHKQSHSGAFFAISGNGNLRWIVPANSSFGLSVIEKWKPYGLKSRVKWYLLRLLYRMNWLSKVPSVISLDLTQTQNMSVIPLKAIKKEAQSSKRRIVVVPVVYVGTPGPQQKAVIMLVDVKTKATVAIMKLALGNQAKNSILKEAKILELLPKHGFNDTPKLIDLDKQNGISWQSFVDGKLSPRILTKGHFSLLLGMPKTGNQFTIREQKQQVLVMYESYKHTLQTKQRELIAIALTALNSTNIIDFVIVHGDFCPWNIKQKNKFEVVPIDWEDAKVEGLPLWDFCHFSFIQAYLFNEDERIYGFVADISKPNSYVNQYTKQKKITTDDTKQLVLLYILFMTLNKNTNPNYSKFLLNQITQVIN